MIWVTVKSISERQGFEPWEPCGSRALQARAIDHSATSPDLFFNWRRVEDSNLRSTYVDNGFRDRRIRPLCQLSAVIFNGGGERIRTPGGLAPSTVFKTAAFDRSAISPAQKYVLHPISKKKLKTTASCFTESQYR